MITHGNTTAVSHFEPPTECLSEVTKTNCVENR